MNYRMCEQQWNKMKRLLFTFIRKRREFGRKKWLNWNKNYRCSTFSCWLQFFFGNNIFFSSFGWLINDLLSMALFGVVKIFRISSFVANIGIFAFCFVFFIDKFGKFKCTSFSLVLNAQVFLLSYMQKFFSCLKCTSFSLVLHAKVFLLSYMDKFFSCLTCTSFSLPQNFFCFFCFFVVFDFWKLLIN